jgi:membrane dipeptidase
MSRVPSWAVVLSVALLGCAQAAASHEGQGPGGRDDRHLARARALLRATPLVDGHNDLPWVIRNLAAAPGDVAAYDLRRRVPAPGDTDFPRLAEGQVGAQFWSVYIPADLKEGFARTQLEQIDIARQVIARYPDKLHLALRAEDVEPAFRAGRIASFLGIEGGHAIENSLGALRAYYDLGVRYMTLTHGKTLDWADAAGDTPRHQGLTPFGKEVVREMNRLGMLVDLSHVTPEVMRDALDASEAPVIFSHSSARALTDHVRNVPDEILKRMAQNGGVVMVTFVPSFVSEELRKWEDVLAPRLKAAANSAERERIRKEDEAARGPAPKATLAQVADHIDHVRKVAGADHVGIGGDYFGSGNSPVGLEDVSRYPHLVAELARRGWSDDDLKKLVGGNLLRTMRAAESVAARLQKMRPPSQATVTGKPTPLER